MCFYDSARGFMVLRLHRCKKCKGSKKVKEKNRQEIFIEKGMADKQRIVLTGAGDQEVYSCVKYKLKVAYFEFSLAFQ